jgi:hypothetical protein
VLPASANTDIGAIRIRLATTTPTLLLVLHNMPLSTKNPAKPW